MPIYANLCEYMQERVAMLSVERIVIILIPFAIGGTLRIYWHK